MSVHREQLVDLTTPEADVDARTEQLRRWLADSGWGTGAGAEDWYFGDVPALELGPAAREAFPELGGGTVLVTSVAGGAWVAGEGTHGPVCPACQLDSELWDAIEAWSGGAEPTLRCPACGHEGLVGDWDLGGSVAFGAVGVVLDPAPERSSAADVRDLVHALRAALIRDLGGRWAYVHLRV